MQNNFITILNFYFKYIYIYKIFLIQKPKLSNFIEKENTRSIHSGTSHYCVKINSHNQSLKKQSEIYIFFKNIKNKSKLLIDNHVE